MGEAAPQNNRGCTSSQFFQSSGFHFWIVPYDNFRTPVQNNIRDQETCRVALLIRVWRDRWRRRTLRGVHLQGKTAFKDLTQVDFPGSWARFTEYRLMIRGTVLYCEVYGGPVHLQLAPFKCAGRVIGSVATATPRPGWRRTRFHDPCSRNSSTNAASCFAPGWDHTYEPPGDRCTE